MRVLVVEDHAKMRLVLRRGLEQAGYDVVEAIDGAEAVRVASSRPFDLVLLDVMLPGMDGFAVCRQLRDGGNAVPVLMLTARDAVADRVTGLDGGADDYLVKPFAFAELLSRMRTLLRRAGPSRAAPLRCGPLEVDVGGRSVTCGGEPVSLSAKEFDLLAFLLRHPGQVLTRATILEHVWDYSYDGLSNVVDVYVKYLRDKIDRPFGLHVLQTVRGVGYRVTCPPT